MKIYQKLIALFLISAFGIFAVACKNEQDKNTNDAMSNTNSAIPPGKIIDAQPSYAQSPTEAYKGLFEAVKSKDTEQIKSFMTQQTMAFAQAQAEMSKETLAKKLENGFLATTMADKLPEIRDERVKDNMGAVEVYNEKEKKWEDTFFMFENGGWKLAIGEVFGGSYKSPGKGKAQIEMEASNKMPGTMPPVENKMPANMQQPANK